MTCMACGSTWSEEIYDLTLSQSPLLIGKHASFLITNVFISVWSLAIDMMSQSTLITSLFPTPCINISLYQDQEKKIFSWCLNVRKLRESNFQFKVETAKFFSGTSQHTAFSQLR